MMPSSVPPEDSKKRKPNPPPRVTAVQQCRPSPSAVGAAPTKPSIMSAAAYRQQWEQAASIPTRPPIPAAAARSVPPLRPTFNTVARKAICPQLPGGTTSECMFVFKIET